MILSAEQMKIAALVGNLRTQNGRGAGRGDFLSCNRAVSGISDIQAAVAECAMALYTGFPWKAYKPAGEHKGRKTCPEPDVGPLEVKSISQPHHKLILHTEPIMNIPHVRLLVKGSEVTFTGWAFGFEVWNEKHWDASLPTPAYARKNLYQAKSLWDWCRQSGWKINPVSVPNFAEGWEPR